MTSPEHDSQEIQKNHGSNALESEHATIKSTNTQGRTAVWFLILLSLALIVAAGTIYYRSFLLYRMMTTSLSSFSNQAKWNQHQISDLQNEFSQLQQQIRKQEEGLRQQAQAVQGAHFPAEPGLSEQARTQGLILDAQYFVELAREQLLVAAQASQTLVFLSLAQNELNKISDSQVLPLKKALAQDITVLKSLPELNETNLYLNLTSLQGQVKNLPLLLVPVQGSEQAPSSSSATVLSGWEKSVQKIWGLLRQTVVVYHLPSAQTPPFITPDQHIYIYENLTTALSEAGWALLHREPDIYRKSLDQVVEGVRHYCVLESSLTKSFLNELQKLQAVSMQTEKVTLVSPKAFQDYLKKEPKVLAPSALSS